jgi:UDP-N-acetylmuramate--alanine ligase
MIAQILIAAQRDPSVLVGGIAPGLKSNLRTGRGQEFVVETDESDNRLHETTPTIPVLTNIDADHLENYDHDVNAIEAAMTRFMGSLDARDPHSILIGCGDDVRVQRVLALAKAQSRRPMLNYGFNSHNLLRAIHVESTDGGMAWRFDALGPFGVWQDIYLPMPGRHNVLNALAAMGVAWSLGINTWTIRAALAAIERVGRRFEIKCSHPVRVVDDYGHHPTEIALTLTGARTSTRKRLAVLFQPHRYTRTQSLFNEFAACFSAADAVFLLPVYSAGEAAIEGVTHEALAAAIRRAGHPQVQTCGTRAEAVAALLNWSREGDTIVTQGAGDVTRAANELVAGF